MFKVRHNIILFFILCLNSVLLADTGLNVYLDSNKKEINEQFVLTIEFTGNTSSLKDFKLPKMPDFIVLSKNENIQSDKWEKTYTLVSKKVGTFSIPSISVNDGINKVISEPINLEVCKSGSMIQKKFNGRVDKNISVETFVDNAVVYVNQCINYVFRFSTKLDLSSNPSYVMPMFKDFWKEDSKVSSGYRLIDGTNYFVYEVKTQLYPMKEGAFIIPEVSVDVKYLEFDGSDENINEFNKIVNSKEKMHSTQTNRVQIKVFPLPESGKPENFTGAVGRYSISANMDKQSASINEPVVLSVIIRGDGNLNTITEPTIELPNDVKKYASFVKVTVDKNIHSKTFQCIIIPLIEGHKTIQPIIFSYFNPNLKDYVVVRTQTMHLDVSSGKYKSEKEINEDINIAIKGKEIEDIKDVNKNLSTHQYKKYLILNKFYVFVHLPFILFLLFALAYRIRIIYIQRDPIKVQKINSYKKAKLYLKKAHKLLNSDQQIEFYSNINMALVQYLKYKTNCDYENITKTEIIEKLIRVHLDKDLVKEIKKILTDYEFVRYAPIKSKNLNMNKTYDSLEYILEKLDKIL